MEEQILYETITKYEPQLEELQNTNTLMKIYFRKNIKLTLFLI
jgi:hypothetical protein